jgi:hypothetical protein
VPQEVRCHCALCNIEARLLSDLSFAEVDAIGELFSTSHTLRQHSSVSSLVLHLKTSPVDATSDTLLRELLAIRALNPRFIESLLVLTFLPMLHGTIRRVARQQPVLSTEDITQQALSFLLQYLDSNELRARQTHFAFAISRAVKHKIFEWAQRETKGNGIVPHSDAALLNNLAEADPFERHLLLRHFLNRCVKKRLITDSELNLLIQFKLDGGSLEPELESNGNSTNALRQKLKRLLKKLRQLARER